MKFLKYLNESGFQGTDIITFEDAIDIARKHCMDNMLKQPVMFKGIKVHSIGDCMIVRPSTTERKSANTNNYYTWLMSDVLPNWQKYPKRSKSVICTTDYHTADGYAGDNIPFAVIPFDGSKIGVCRDTDLWDSFGDISIYFHGLANFNDFIEEFIRRCIQEDVPVSLSMFKNQIRQMNEYLKDISDEFLMRDIEEAVDKAQTNTSAINKAFEDIKKYKSFDEYLQNIPDPVKNKFTLVTSLKSIDRFSDNECWSDGDCLFINADKYKEFYYAVMSGENK